MDTDPASAAPAPEPQQAQQTQQPQAEQTHQHYPPAHPVGYTQPYPEAQPQLGQPQPGQPYPYAGQPYGAPALPAYPSYRADPPPPQRGTSFGLAVAAALIWPVGVLVLLFALAGAPGNLDALPYMVGYLMFPWLISALITWLIFRRKQQNFFVLLLVSLPFFFVMLTAAGMMGSR